MIYFFNDIAKEHFKNVLVFSIEGGLLYSLREQLDILERMAVNQFGKAGCVILTRDFAPYSFTWATNGKRDGTGAAGMNGGLIYSGPVEGGEVMLDGGFPAFTVSLSEHKIGWSIHT